MGARTIRLMLLEEKMIYCCGCEKEVDAQLVSGAVIYPHRQDLAWVQFPSGTPTEEKL